MTDVVSRHGTLLGRLAGDGRRRRALLPSANFRDNNFDLLRLLAALQVVYFHVYLHLHVELPWRLSAINGIVSLFPCVPIFFVISGFLVSRSYERSPDAWSYARNRFLRLYPGLWTCLAFSLVLVWAFGFLSKEFVLSYRFAAWLITQLTFLQDYNPPEFRGFGTGVVNGSLWTIPIEVSFYAVLPLLYSARRRIAELRVAWLLCSGLILASYATYFVVTVVGDRETNFLLKLLDVTLAPHLFLFLTGVLVQRYWDRVSVFFEGRLALWTVPVLVLGWTHRDIVLGLKAGSLPGLLELVAFATGALSRLALAGWTLAFAFSHRSWSATLLRHNDLSYGVYIYHALVLNSFLELGWTRRPVFLVAAAAITLASAWLSWRFVERPALARKRNSIAARGGSEVAQAS